VVRSSGRKKICDFRRQRLPHFLVRIQTQNPIPRRLVNRRVLLRGVALPFFDEDFRAKGFCDLNRTVSRTRVDDDNFSFAVRHQRLHARERASDVGLFVIGDDYDRKRHEGRIQVAGRWLLVASQVTETCPVPTYARNRSREAEAKTGCPRWTGAAFQICHGNYG